MRSNDDVATRQTQRPAVDVIVREEWRSISVQQVRRRRMPTYLRDDQGGVVIVSIAAEGERGREREIHVQREA